MEDYYIPRYGGRKSFSDMFLLLLLHSIRYSEDLFLTCRFVLVRHPEITVLRIYMHTNTNYPSNYDSFNGAASTPLCEDATSLATMAFVIQR